MNICKAVLSIDYEHYLDNKRGKMKERNMDLGPICVQGNFEPLVQSPS